MYCLLTEDWFSRKDYMLSYLLRKILTLLCFLFANVVTLYLCIALTKYQTETSQERKDQF